MITFRDVTKKFDGRTVLDRVSFTVNPGEFVCITGPSGAGKSTLVHLFIRAEVPTDGVIEVDGQDLAKLPRPILQLYRRRTGVVFQDYKLLPDRTIFENTAFPMEACGDSTAAIVQRVPFILQRVGLGGREQAYPHELSGGEKARATLARALVHNPMVVIADEPTGNIDPAQSVAILELLKEVNKEGVTVILATHANTLVDALQTRVLRLEGGRIVRDTVGGYDTGSVLSSSAPQQSHRLLEKKTPPVTTTVPVSGDTPSSSSGGASTIKPIRI